MKTKRKRVVCSECHGTGWGNGLRFCSKCNGDGFIYRLVEVHFEATEKQLDRLASDVDPLAGKY